MMRPAKRFELLEHTADIGLAAYGANLGEAFEAAAQGMFAVIAEPDSVREKLCFPVDVTGEDYESLLVEWLNELLYLFDVENVLLRGFSVREITATHLTARVCGEMFDPARHQINLGVKAATYHAVSVERTDGVRLKVILDV